MRSLLLAGFVLAGCTGGAAKPDVDTDQPPPPQVLEVKKSLPKPKGPGLRTMTADSIQKAFLPEAKITGVNGRECGAWKDRVIVTRPAKGGGFDLRIRARTDDPVGDDEVASEVRQNNLEEDCKWEGDALIDGRVEGRVVGVIWPHVVIYQEKEGGAGLLQVMRGTHGSITAEVAQAMHPRYTRTLVVGFSVPVRPDLGEITEERPCQAAIDEAWAKTLEEMDAAGQLHPKLDRTQPRCDPMALETCKLAFAFPYELVLSETSGQPAAGPVGCLGLPE